MLARYPALLGRSASRALFHSSAARWAKSLKRFKLADIGEGITECEVIKWSVKPSSVVEAFTPLCEVQSDKASVEITSPFDGVVKSIMYEEGQVAKVGDVLCTIEVEEDDATSVEQTESQSDPTRSEAADPGPSSQATTETSVPPVREASKPARRPHPLDPNAPQDTRTAFHTAQSVLATPSVRHYAREHSVDLSLLAPGSGKEGRIEKSDVDAFLKAGSARPEPRASQGTAPLDLGQEVTVELNRTRYGMWKAMEKSLEIPTFGFTTTLDLTALHDLLPVLNSHIPHHYLPAGTAPPAPQIISPASFYPPPPPPDVPDSARFKRLTYLPLLLKTLSRAMLEWPLFRSSIAPTEPGAKPTLTLRPTTDISLALSTPTGLYTPTLPAVSGASVYSLASRLAHLAHLGRQVPCGLTPREMPRRGGTISVSNVGGVGAVESASPVLVPGGGVAIVAIGRAKWVWDVDGKGREHGERRLKVGVSWTADHRVVEGAELVAFTEAWRGWVEAPQRLIGEGI